MSSAREPAAGAALARSSRVMAVGTVASRGTGFLRTSAIVAALGTQAVGDAYNAANTLPNIVYELLLGGVLTSVLVPLLVAAAHDDPDGGEGYAQRLLTLVAVGLGAATALAVLAAPLLTALYGLGDDPAQDRLATTLARLLLVEIVFYGVGATMGAILNTRGSYAAPMWAPVLNNLVVVATAGVFVLMPGPKTLDPDTITTPQVLVLGIGTTLGIVAQTVALLPALRAVGFRWRWRLDLAGARLGEAGRLAGWMLCYVAVSQVGYLVVVNLAVRAGQESRVGYTAYVGAFVLFQLPHAIVTVSVITALLPRMSRAAVEGRLDGVTADLSTGTRLVAVVLVPATALLAALGPLVATVVFAHGRTSVADARAVGTVLSAFALGLLPFSVSQLQLRAFYALRDTRTPALVNVAANLVRIGACLLCVAVLPVADRVTGLAVANGLASVTALVVSGLLLHRRLGSVDARRSLRTVIRLGVAAVAGGLVAGGLSVLLDRVTGDGPPGPAVAVLVLVVAGAAGLAAAFAVALRLRVGEVRELAGTLRRR